MSNTCNKPHKSWTRLRQSFNSLALASGLVLGSASAWAEPVNIAVLGDSMSAEYVGDYDPEGLLASITESFGMGMLSSTTDCSGGNFGSNILAALLDGIMPMVPMVTNLPSRNWVQQLQMNRGDQLNFGAYTDDPWLYGEPRLRGFEYNFARVSGTALSPGLGNHHLAEQLAAALPYLQNGDIDIVYLMIGSNDFAARELKQQSFCDDSWFEFEDALIASIFDTVDTVTAAGVDKVMVGLIPLGTASGVAEGIVLQRINETNARILAEAAGRGIPAFDPWRFNQNPAIMNPATGEVFIGPYTVAQNSVASIDDAVTMPTPGYGLTGACTRQNKCGTLATTLNFISTDGLHPGTVPQGFLANEIIKEMNAHYGLNIASLSDQEILEAGGTFVPVPGQVTDSGKWVNIEQRAGSNKCLSIRGDNSNMTVSRCSSSDSKQRWYVVPFNGGHMLRSAYTVSGHDNGTCVVDDGWRFKVANCSTAKTQQFNIYGGGSNDKWFIKAASRDACLYRYSWYEDGNTYGSLGNCGLYYGKYYMNWGFRLNGGSNRDLSSVQQ